MLGFAQKLFNATNEKSVFFKPSKAALHDWSFLVEFFETYELNFIDIETAKTLLKNHTLEFESVAAFICHLSNAVRCGHLMVKVENNEIFPSIQSIWTKDAKISDGDLEKFKNFCLAGFKELDCNVKFKKLVTKNPTGFATTNLCQIENRIYFQRYFNFETTVLTQLLRLQGVPPKLTCDSQKVSVAVQELLQNKTLLEAQAEAVLKASNQTVTLICGGPGTGKTYTAGYLLKIILDSLKTDKVLKVALAAPTGKAASNLQKSLSHLIDSTSKAKTLHQLMGIRSDGRSSNQVITLDADIILIDESSMIDVAMMAKLLSAIKTGTRVIFLGDAHQLPSVDAGAMFSDIASINSEIKTTLQICLRAELQEIVDFGKGINEGKSDLIFKMLKNGTAVQKIELNTISEESLFEQFKNRFPLYLNENSDPVSILRSFDQFKILSPLRKGSFGVDSLNHLFFDRLVQRSSQPITVPIMLLRNNSNLELFNGEVGVLVLLPRQNDESFHAKKGDYALFPCKINGFRKFPALLLPPYEYAYALSVHKSQGSEFNDVLCLLPTGSEHFGREVFYTAVTRARKTLMIFGEEAVIEATIKNKNERLSGLITRANHAKKNSCLTS